MSSLPTSSCIFHGLSWKLFVKCDDLSRRLMVVHGLIHQGKLILAKRIYETFELYARQIVKCCRTFCILAVFLQIKMSCQFQMPLQGILLDFSLTSLPLKCTEVGHHVQRVTKLLPDQPDMSGNIRNCSKCLFFWT